MFGETFTHDEHSSSLDYFAKSLASNSQMDAIYLGFDNGDFFLVWKLSSDAQSRRAFAAPDEASYVVQRIENDYFKQPLHLTSYYDADLRLISVNSDFVTGFDPRSRPWYREAIDAMKSALRRFVELTNATLGELEIDALGDLAIEHIAPACEATSATVILLSDDKRQLVRVHSKPVTPGKTTGYEQAADYRSDVIELPEKATSETILCPDQHAAYYRKRVWIDDITSAHNFDTEAYHAHSVLVLPLLTSNGELAGVIHLGDIKQRDGKELPANNWLFAEALAAHAGLAFENQRLAEARRNSFEALIRLLARAIDAKPPHTGKHCQRVPILCTLLAEAASESTLPAFSVYSVFKEDDFGTNLVKGKYRDTALATTFKRVRENRISTEAIFSDFAAYAPSDNLPAAFLGTPIMRDGQFAGAIIAQLKHSRLNTLIQANNPSVDKHRVFLAGTDAQLRAGSGFTSDEVLQVSYDKQSVEAALSNRAGITESTGFLGNNVVVAYAPMRWNGVVWALIVELDKNTVDSSVKTLRAILAISVLLCSTLAFVAGWLLADRPDDAY